MGTMTIVIKIGTRTTMTVTFTVGLVRRLAQHDLSPTSQCVILPPCQLAYYYDEFDDDFDNFDDDCDDIDDDYDDCDDDFDYCDDDGADK